MGLTEPKALPPPPGRPGGEGRVRGADVLICGATPLTLPRFRRGPLPLPPKGRRGAFRRISGGNSSPPMQFISNQALRPRLAGARQADRELGELAYFAIHRDRSAVLLAHDIVADRPTKPAALARPL